MSSNELPLAFVKKVKNVINNEYKLENEEEKVLSDGSVHWIQTSVMPIFDDDNIKIGEVIVNYDVTDKKTFEKLSITDGLTGLYNRRYFNETLKREINRALRDKEYLSFLILDIDFFKKYNDSYGHDAGDKALIRVAHTLQDSLQRGGDFAFRLGGEEFGVLFSKENEKDSFALAEKIRKNIEALKIEHSNSSVAKCITVSVGLLNVNFANESVDEHGFYTMADDALYQAKENRNKVVMYENDELEFF
jgi:diguanylate cyclase (GGDEF)-like protein